MKKFLAIILASLAMVAVFASCGAKEEVAFKDGEYHAELANYDDHGWKDYVDVTVKDGKIALVTFDAVNEEDGRKKTEDAAYKEAYVGAGFDTYPADSAAKLAADLVAKQDIAKVDTVAGATNSTNAFKVLVSALIQNMKDGNTTPVIY